LQSTLADVIRARQVTCPATANPFSEIRYVPDQNKP
jgi:hypothetical protein